MDIAQAAFIYLVHFIFALIIYLPLILYLIWSWSRLSALITDGASTRTMVFRLVSSAVVVSLAWSILLAFALPYAVLAFYNYYDTQRYGEEYKQLIETLTPLVFFPVQTIGWLISLVPGLSQLERNLGQILPFFAQVPTFALITTLILLLLSSVEWAILRLKMKHKAGSTR